MTIVTNIMRHENESMSLPVISRLWACLVELVDLNRKPLTQEARGGCDGRLLLHLQGGRGDGRLLRE